MAGKVLNSYPDYAKATPGYTASIVEIFADYPPNVQEALADKRTGIVSRCEYLPTVAAIVKLAGEIEAEIERREAVRAKPKRYAEASPPSSSYCPFPQLWRAFHSEPELLNAGFEKLSEACRVLVLQGREASRTILVRAAKGKAA